MKETEKIPVFVRVVKGKTVCICHAGAKGCGKNCMRDTVTRDRYDQWEQTMRRNRYGQ
ncbi:MAG: hypothetical protein IJ418_02245 [Clostridia bacterium]|nr:hypothetical protein [Clostridia bacterium]